MNWVMDMEYSKYLISLVIIVGSLNMAGCTVAGPAIAPSVSKYHYYNISHTGVIYSYKANCFELGCPEIKNADARTFKPLSGQYAVDKNHVYYETKIIPNELPDSFSYLGGYYASSNNKVYWKGKIVDKVDPDSFTVKKYIFSNYNNEALYDYYGVTDSEILCWDKVLSNNPEKLHALEKMTYFSDEHYIYRVRYCERYDADLSAFKFLKKKDGVLSLYAMDSTHVYNTFNGLKILEGADPETFEVLCTGVGPPHYARDKHSVYGMVYGNINKLEGADPNTFEFPEECF